MIWLLIFLVLAVVISPLMMMKNSLRQRSITHHRDIARKLSIKVSLQRRPEARDSEDRLEAVCYWRPWSVDIKANHWVLHRYSQRGWPSAWPNWYWFQAEAGDDWQLCLQAMLNILPATISAIVVDSSGVGLIWNEHGDEATVHKINTQLESLIKKGKEIYL